MSGLCSLEHPVPAILSEMIGVKEQLEASRRLEKKPKV